MVSAIDDSYLKKRYALLEAKRISDFLKEEPPETVIKIAKFFNWKIRRLSIQEGGKFTLHFADFLRNASIFHEKEWKLVNRQIVKGEVTLTQSEAVRLLEEEVKRHIEKRLQTTDFKLPETIAARVDHLKQLLMLRKGELKTEEMPKTIVVDAFPPCVKALYTAITGGHHLSHMGRLTLTTFLINIGMDAEDVINLYRSLSDFNERLTRYQVEHIAGARGSRTKYRPPKCDTLRTHGICINPDETCERIRHPLKYYQRKLRTTQKPSS
jgi:DNA primase large subunit